MFNATFIFYAERHYEILTNN